MFVRRPLTMLFGTSSLYRGAKLNEMRFHPMSLRLNLPVLITADDAGCWPPQSQTAQNSRLGCREVPPGLPTGP